MKRPNFFVSVLHVLGIVALRFRMIPRVWAIWLMAVNLACVFFITHIEAQVALAVAGIASLLMAAVYQRYGFIRILGVFHAAWVPMLAWFASRWEIIQQDQALATWIALLMVTNTISLVVDAWDVRRFVKGERAPSYAW